MCAILWHEDLGGGLPMDSKVKSWIAYPGIIGGVGIKILGEGEGFRPSFYLIIKKKICILFLFSRFQHTAEKSGSIAWAKRDQNFCKVPGMKGQKVSIYGHLWTEKL